MTPSVRKRTGSYFTPDRVVSCLVRWVVRCETDRLLDPSCGDGRFIASHRNSVGIEQDGEAAATASERAPRAIVRTSDFFEWAGHTSERFDCAAGNPPFIRYQSFNGEVRKRALRLCAAKGARFSGLASSWAPFLVAAAALLRPSGRMAFVVPAEIGHAPYASPLLKYLVGHFNTVQVIAVREKLFPQLSEDCWLLYADGFGGSTDELRFSALQVFEDSDRPPSQFTPVSVREWSSDWNNRLRPFLLPLVARQLYQATASHPRSKRFGTIARTRIGYVTGMNDFFHLRPSHARSLNIPEALLHPTVRNGRALPARELTSRTVHEWMKADLPVLLLRIPRTAEIPKSVRRYLDSEMGRRARHAYKCRTRTPWYSVPDVRVPDLFLTYLSGLRPSLVRNSAAATCTNTVHSVDLLDRSAMDRIKRVWETPFVSLSCELEGHPLGGGVLKLELGEVSRVVLPGTGTVTEASLDTINEAVTTMRSWRHYAVGK